MKDKNKKKMPYVIIGILILVIIYLLLRPEIETPLTVADTGSCSNSNTNTGYTGYCDDGGRYHCYITCTDTPPTIPRPTDNGLPTDGTTCRNYATSKGYLASAWDSSINSITGCQNWVLSHACSVPTKIDVINNCCMWTC